MKVSGTRGKIPIRKQTIKEAAQGYAFILPSLIGFSLFFVIPFIFSLYYCFTKGIGGTEFVGFENFIDLLKSESFTLAAKNTLIFNSISVPVIIVFSLAIALLLNGGIKGTSYFRMIFVMPLVIPVASIILVWNIAFKEYGFFSGIIADFGFEPIDWLGSKWSVFILLLLFVWKNCGYNVVLFLAGLNNIPKEYYEAAKIDGAGKITIFKSITLPYLIPSGFFVFIMSIINSFKVFREAYLLAGSYPYEDLYMLQHFMNNNFFNLSYQRLTTSAFLMAIFICALVVILFKVEARFKDNF